VSVNQRKSRVDDQNQAMKIITPIPNDVYLALSGGVDSMVMRNFLISGRKRFKCLFMNHGTETSLKALEFLSGLVPDLIVGNLKTQKKAKESDEMYWRRERYNFFDKHSDRSIITCHHLDDQVENWFMTCAKGQPRLIPYKRNHFIRPMILCKKDEIISYAKRNNVEYLHDSSNDEMFCQRNVVRHKIVPEMKKAFPGVYKSISRIITSELLVMS
jgi:tRNA(Ile)-lysidine synthase